MTSTPGASRTVSPFEAAREAVSHTRRRLFPIRIQTWLVLGFLAFLDQLGRTTWGAGGGGRGGDDGERHREAIGLAGGQGEWSADLVAAINSALAWLSAHATLVIVGGLAALILGAGLVALVLWINARGTFLYLDAVTSGRAEVRRPWREHARRADSYFVWSFGIVVAALVPLGVGLAVAAALAIAFAQGRLGLGVPSGVAVVVALLPLVVILFLVIPLLFLARIALRDFVAPLQLATGAPCGEAARLFETLLLAHLGAFALYLLLKLALWVVTGIVVIVGGCLTCCVGFIPIVMQTLFQPLFHFERAWSVFLLRQMGYGLPVG
jgi:hypothetical protein